MLHILKNLSINAKVIGSLVLSLLIFSALSALVSSHLITEEIHRRAVDEELPALVQGIRADIQRQLAPPIHAARGLADNTFLVEWYRAGMPESGYATWLRYAKAIKKQQGAEAVFWGAESNMRYYTDDGQTRPIAPSEAWFPATLNAKVDYALNIDFDVAAQKYMMFINVRVDGPEGQRAATGLGLSVEALAQSVAQYHIAHSGLVYLVRANGSLLIHRDKSLIDGKHFLKDMPGLDAPMAQQLLGSTSFQQLRYQKDGAEHLIVSMPIPELQAYVIAEVPVDALTTPMLRAVRLAGLVALLVGGIMALAVAWGVSRAIAAPVRGAVTLLAQIADGDLTRRIPSDNRDEIGQLGQAINRLVEALTVLVHDVRESAQHLRSDASRIANGSSHLGQRTDEQAGNVQRTAASMEELTTAVRHNTATAQHAAQIANQATGAAQQGGQVVAQMVQTMRDIHGTSAQIADITSVIDGIAFQTNILALNAAVEAARAGEQGRGFAVVASEVRTLAQRSAEAAKQIKELIQANVHTVEQGSQQAAGAGSAMDNILQQVSQMDKLVQEISHASQEQSQGLEQIGSAVAEMDTVTQQNSTLVEESTSVATHLEQQARHLTDLMAPFRL